MKLIGKMICAGTLVLAVSAFGAKADNNNNAKAKARKGPAQAGATANAGAVHANGAAHANRNMGGHVNGNTSVNRNHARAAGSEHNAMKNSAHVNREVTNRKVVNRTVVNKTRVQNIKVVNNWRGSNRFAGAKYVVFRNYHREFHDAGWWHSHYSRVVFIGGGWYAWNEGYWYPAWGYAPGITFAFDGPIYARNDWTPDRVTIAVQEQLQRDGYYDGAIDGELGEYTRQALAAYQEDHGLEVTSAIDEPTLDTMGVA